MGIGVSVIVCTHNGADRLKPVLEAIQNQQTDFLSELILVDNCSTDGTSSFAELALRDTPLRWKLIEEPKAGLSFARLAGIRAASHEYLLFCDDDNALFPDYLQKGVTVLEANPRIGVLGGAGIPQFSSPKPIWFNTYQSTYAVGPQGEGIGKVSNKRGYVYGAGAFFRKTPLLEIFNSGFQPFFTGRKLASLSAGDDVELCLLMQLKGFEIWFDPALQFYHAIPERRLQWDYYLKMKAGIAAGAAAFFTYDYFMQDRKRSVLGYSIAYFKNAAFYQLLLLKNAFLGKSTPEAQLGKLILKVKAKAFRTSFGQSKNHFIQLSIKF